MVPTRPTTLRTTEDTMVNRINRLYTGLNSSLTLLLKYMVKDSRAHRI
jgi:hypothetical protein